MILDEQVYLEHFGVKGMKWGKRNTGGSDLSPKTARRKNRQMERLDPNSAMLGWGLKGHEAQKIHNRRMKKDPEYVKEFAKKYKPLPPKEAKKFDRRLAGTLITMNGVKIKNLDLHGVKGKDYKSVGKNKGDTGRKVAAGLIAAGVMAHTIRSIIR